MTRAYVLRPRRTRSATKGQLGPSGGCHQCLEDMQADLLWITFSRMLARIQQRHAAPKQ